MSNAEQRAKSKEQGDRKVKSKVTEAPLFCYLALCSVAFLSPCSLLDDVEGRAQSKVTAKSKEQGDRNVMSKAEQRAR